MAAVRARRPGSRSRKAAPAPTYEGMPRLARIKLSGGLRGDDVQVTGRSLAVGMSSVLLFFGAAVAGAAWLGSSLFDAREAFARAADSTAAHVGFEIAEVRVAGVAGARAEEVRAIAAPEGRRSVLALDPADVKTRVESLDWVQSARVRRLWPSTLLVEVERRRAYARWRENGQMAVIDVNGERLLAERAVDHPELPLIEGRGAGPAAEPLLIALEDLPALRARLARFVRVGDRRWNLELNSGATVALPEEGAEEAMQRLETLQTQHAILDRRVAVLDMRAPGRLAVRVHPQLAGGPRGLLGGA